MPFEPLHNPAGFGVADFVELGLAILFAGFFLARPYLEPIVRGSPNARSGA
jgi:hypothetical protein